MLTQTGFCSDCHIWHYVVNISTGMYSSSLSQSKVFFVTAIAPVALPCAPLLTALACKSIGRDWPLRSCEIKCSRCVWEPDKRFRKQGTWLGAERYGAIGRLPESQWVTAAVAMWVVYHHTGGVDQYSQLDLENINS